MRRKCERGRGNINADGAGAEVFVGDGCSQGASFGPMVAISRRGQGGRIYNNTRTRERLRRKCVKPADLTTHSPPKVFAYPPRTATRPSRALLITHAAPTHARRLRDAFPADRTTHSRRRPPLAHAQRHALPEHFRSPTQPRRTPADLTTHSPPTAQLTPRSATLPPLPFRFGHKKNGTAQCMCDAECLGRPSLRSVIWVGEPRAVRHRCGALACRRGA